MGFFSKETDVKETTTTNQPEIKGPVDIIITKEVDGYKVGDTITVLKEYYFELMEKDAAIINTKKK